MAKHSNVRHTPLRDSILLLLGVLVVSFIVGRILTSFITFTVVSGESMLPTYQDKDMLITVKQMEYAIGDPIVYKPNSLDCENCHVIHRIIEGNSTDGWVTQGDNNASPDPWMPTDDEILGKVVFHVHVPSQLHIIYAPQLWFTIFMVIILMFALDIFYHYWKRHHHDETFDERQEDRAEATRQEQHDITQAHSTDKVEV